MSDRDEAEKLALERARSTNEKLTRSENGFAAGNAAEAKPGKESIAASTQSVGNAIENHDPLLMKPGATPRQTNKVDERTGSDLNATSSAVAVPSEKGQVDPHAFSSDGQSAESMSPSLRIEQLIEDYSRFLFGYAYRLSGTAVDAEDLTQQTFLIAHQKLDQLRNVSSVKSWLCAILRSSWLKSLRRTRPVPASDFELELEDILECRLDESPVDEQAVQNLVAELPDDYRLVVLMYYFEELSYREIAERLGVRIGTVMSRLSRAKSRIRERLARLNKEDDL